MGTVTSADGTSIGYTTVGQGPALILVDGALRSRSFGLSPRLAARLAQHFTVYTYDRRGRGESGDTLPYAPDREVEDLAALLAAAGQTGYVFGHSAGGALALAAAKRLNGITKLAVYEPPFIVDDSRVPLTDDFVAGLAGALAAGRRDAALKMFAQFADDPPFAMSVLMPRMPFWAKLAAAAHTIPYDLAIVGEYQRGRQLRPADWAAVKIPVLVGLGGKSPAWMHASTRALADVLPDARYQALPGQTHMFRPEAIAPVLTEFLC